MHYVLRMCVYMYMHARMHVCAYVRVSVCTMMYYVRTYKFTYVRMDVRMDVRIHVRMHMRERELTSIITFEAPRTHASFQDLTRQLHHPKQRSKRESPECIGLTGARNTLALILNSRKRNLHHSGSECTVPAEDKERPPSYDGGP